MSNSLPISSSLNDGDEPQGIETDGPKSVEVTVLDRKVTNPEFSDECEGQADEGAEQNDAENDREPLQRKRGRPKILRTGLRGRPRKEYHALDFAKVLEETACLAEVPIESAVNGPHADEWHQAIASEMRSIMKNNIYTVTDRPKNRKVISS